MVLSIFIGAGVQILCVTIVLTIYSLYDFYFDKGALMYMAVAVFPMFGIINGYTAARFYTFFNCSSWTSLACWTSTFLPGLISSMLMVIDLCEWIETGRADTIPVREAAFLASYWFFFHVPSCFFGSYLGFTYTRIEAPVKKNRMERERKDDQDTFPWYCEMPYMSAGASFLPSLMIMMQLWQLMDSVNGTANIHALHGMLYVIFVLFLIVVVEAALIYNYLILLSE